MSNLMPAVTTDSQDGRYWLRLTLAFAAVYLIWGSTYLGIKIAIETLPPFVMAGSRFMVAGLILYAFSRPSAGRPTLANWRVSALVGGLLLVGGNGLVCFAQQRVPSGLAALLVGTLPLWMSVINWNFFGGPIPTTRVFISIGVGICGLALLLGSSNLLTTLDQSRYAMALLAAPISWAFGSLRSRQGGQSNSIWLNTAMQMICGGSMLFLLGVFRGEAGLIEFTRITTESLAAWFYLVVFGSIVAFSAFTWLMKNVEPDLVATYAFVNPMIAVLLGWILADETLRPIQFIGMLLVIGAVALTVIKPKRRTGPMAPSTNNQESNRK